MFPLTFALFKKIFPLQEISTPANVRKEMLFTAVIFPTFKLPPSIDKSFTKVTLLPTYKLPPIETSLRNWQVPIMFPLTFALFKKVFPLQLISSEYIFFVYTLPIKLETPVFVKVLLHEICPNICSGPNVFTAFV